MSFSGLLNDKCDIYHLKTSSDGSPGFGLPTQINYIYSTDADLKDIPCHFNANGGLNINQQDPQKYIDEVIKLNLPKDIDVRVNDKIVNKFNNISYIAGPPKLIRNHHIIVVIRREKEFL